MCQAPQYFYKLRQQKYFTGYSGLFDARLQMIEEKKNMSKTSTIPQYQSAPTPSNKTEFSKKKNLYNTRTNEDVKGPRLPQQYKRPEELAHKT